MIDVFALHSPYGLMTAAAAIDAGLVPPAVDADGAVVAPRRVLLAVGSSAVPETAPDLAADPAWRTLRDRFDRVESLNALVDPHHPRDWIPAEQDHPMLGRLLRRAWDAETERIRLFVQSPQVAPARTLMTLFDQAEILVVGDGLMTYSPIRDRLPRQVTERIAGVILADVVPGVVPLVFVETGAPRIPVPAPAVRAVIDEVDAGSDAPVRPAGGEPVALVLGQYLAALGLATEAEEQEMQAQMVDRAAEWGVAGIVFKPHPAATAGLVSHVRERAAAHGLSFAVHEGDEPAELVARRIGAEGVVAGFSTALPTVQTLFGVRIASAGTRTVLRGLTPYENSNRIPATIVDALTRRRSPYARPEDLQLLVDAVGYCMQPRILAALRPRAEELLRRLGRVEIARYFDPERLAALDLPGAPVPTWRDRARRRVGLGPALVDTGGVSRLEQVGLTIQGARRRAARVWRTVRGR
ncbi:polysialyltransferase family glycosyltransferase [Streptomyces sp. MS2A]|nr:polysialyltransferase family glycosyltransferase [Streptomyces sp. MS2A]